MGNPSPTYKIKKGQSIRKGLLDPGKTCTNCGKRKNLAFFPKRGGPTYKPLKNLDPRKYDTQCKLCKKAVRPGQDRSELKEPKQPNRAAATRAVHARRKEEAKQAKAAKNYNRTYKQRIREETRIKSMIYLAEQGCEECTERDPRVLEYDHKEPDDKGAKISRLILDGFSWTAPTLVNELKKCRILCVNCHRRHTIVQQDYYRTDDVQATIGRLAARYKFSL